MQSTLALCCMLRGCLSIYFGLPLRERCCARLRRPAADDTIISWTDPEIGTDIALSFQASSRAKAGAGTLVPAPAPASLAVCGCSARPLRVLCCRSGGAGASLSHERSVWSNATGAVR